MNIYIKWYSINRSLFVLVVDPGSPSNASSCSQRSVESRSMESFFSSRSEMFIKTYTTNSVITDMSIIVILGFLSVNCSFPGDE